MDDCKQKILRAVRDYEDGERTPQRAMEIVAYLLNEKAKKDELDKAFCKTVESWDNGKSTAESALERIGALLRTDMNSAEFAAAKRRILLPEP